MTKPCVNRCTTPLRFPRRPDDPPNRPGLDHFNYRIGTYADFREAMIRQLNATANLSAWTHRGADDPAIALLEGAAILGDILTFYQDLYANEAFLGTAQWRDSVSDSVRLLGYRLSPGLGGRATFAFEVKGTKGVTVPRGFSVKANVDGLDKEAEFETASEFVAYPWLSRFNLFRPLEQLNIDSHATEFYIDSPDQDLNPILLKADDKILLGTPQPATNPTRLDNAIVVIIDSVRQQHGANIYKVKGSFGSGANFSAMAGFKLGRSFHHFGFNAPQTFIDTSKPVKSTTTYGSSSSETTTTPNESPLSFDRNLDAVSRSITATTSATSFGFGVHSSAMSIFLGGGFAAGSAASLIKPAVTVVSPPIQPNEVPLDVEVQDLISGATLLMQLGSSVVIRTISSTAPSAMRWGQQAGTTSLLKLNSNLGFPGHSSADIRELSFYEVLTPLLTVKAARTAAPTAVGSDLFFYGTDAEAQTLTGRNLIIADAEPLAVAVQSVDSLAPLDRPRLRRARLDTIVHYASFAHDPPFLDVFGNLVDATQGKTQQEAIIGSGDNTKIFQTFKVPAAPLTYLLSAGTSPPETPELQIYVNNRLWKYVPTLFGHEAGEEIYIVREDQDNNSYVQFGDGKTGMRLPTGFENVSAVYRTGTGAFGALKEGTKVEGGKLEGLDKIQLPDVSSGGSDPEDGASAKYAAPLKVQSLDRLVGLQDFESEVAAISGVASARAAWQLRNNIPAVVITVLMQSGPSQESDAVRDVISHYNQCRGPNRYPIVVEQGTRLFVRVEIDYGLDPTFREELVTANIAFALGTNSGAAKADDNLRGLFGLRNLHFGQAEYANNIAGVTQNVAGVKWAIVRIFSGLPFADDPATITLDASSAVFNEVVGASNNQILSLFSAHLTLNAIADTVREEC